MSAAKSCEHNQTCPRFYYQHVRQFRYMTICTKNLRQFVTSGLISQIASMNLGPRRVSQNFLGPAPESRQLRMLAMPCERENGRVYLCRSVLFKFRFRRVGVVLTRETDGPFTVLMTCQGRRWPAQISGKESRRTMRRSRSTLHVHRAETRYAYIIKLPSSRYAAK